MHRGVSVIGTEVEYGTLVSGVPPKLSDPYLSPLRSTRYLVSEIVASAEELLDRPLPTFLASITDFAAWARYTAEPREPIAWAFPGIALPDGSRFYVDHEHPEFSAPEHRSPIRLAHSVVEGDAFVAQCAQLVEDRANAASDSGHRAKIELFRQSSDRQGNSHGLHVNVLMPRNPESGARIEQVTMGLAPYLVALQLISGNGKLGHERKDLPRNYGVWPFQLSQRADFVSEIANGSTTIYRPVINTRDEPQADRDKWYRHHIINTEFGPSIKQNALTFGILAILHDIASRYPEMLPKLDVLSRGLVETNRHVSFSGAHLGRRQSRPTVVRDGRKQLRAIEVLQTMLVAIDRYVENRLMGEIPEADCIWTRDALALTVATLDDDWTRATDLSYVAKWRMLELFNRQKGMDLEFDADSRLILGRADVLVAEDISFHRLGSRNYDWWVRVKSKLGNSSVELPDLPMVDLATPPHPRAAVRRKAVELSLDAAITSGRMSGIDWRRFSIVTSPASVAVVRVPVDIDDGSAHRLCATSTAEEFARVAEIVGLSTSDLKIGEVEDVPLPPVVGETSSIGDEQIGGLFLI